MKHSGIQRIVLGAFAAGLVLSFSACSSMFTPKYRDDSGQVTASATINSSALQVGDCILSISNTTSNVGSLTVVPCDTAHEAEVYAVSDSMNNSEDVMKQYCKDQYPGYIGVSWDNSGLQVTMIHAGASKATTVVQCIVYAEGKQVSISYKGSQQ